MKVYWVLVGPVLTLLGAYPSFAYASLAYERRDARFGTPAIVICVTAPEVRRLLPVLISKARGSGLASAEKSATSDGMASASLLSTKAEAQPDAERRSSEFGASGFLSLEREPLCNEFSAGNHLVNWKQASYTRHLHISCHVCSHPGVDRI